MSLKRKLESLFYVDDSEEEAYEQDERAARDSSEAGRGESMQPPQDQQRQSKPNVVSIQSAKKSAEVYLAEPRVYSEARDLADKLLNRTAVLVNLQKVDREQLYRIVDFLSGTVYALDGDIQYIGSQIYLCTPANVEVNGEIQDYLE